MHARNLAARGLLPAEVWGINSAGSVVACTRTFAMDDVRVQERRAAARPGRSVARLLDWLKTFDGPVYTSRPHPAYPNLVAFPLQAVVDDLGEVYFNATPAYALAYAIHLRAPRIELYGLDFSYPNVHQAEQGRACVEYWIGRARGLGLDVVVSSQSRLMSADEPLEAKLYGYDTLHVSLDGRRRLAFAERAEFVTAEEIEARYDHGRR
jgi:hypothetical protein